MSWIDDIERTQESELRIAEEEQRQKANVRVEASVLAANGFSPVIGLFPCVRFVSLFA